MARVIAVANQKGGVAKTTTAVNVAAVLAKQGKRVLLVDVDPQGSASKACGVRDPERTVHEVFEVGPFETPDLIIKLSFGFDLIPSSIKLAATELVDPTYIYALQKGLQEVLNDYDYIVLDAPPALGKLAMNCLAACDEVVIPLQAQSLAIEGLADLTETIANTQERINPGLKVAGIFLTMFDSRKKSHNRILNEARKNLPKLGYNFCSTKIKNCVKFEEAPYEGMPAVLLYNDHSVQDYERLVQELWGDEQ